MNPEVRVEHFGPFDLAKDNALSHHALALRDCRSVRVVKAQVPEGLVLTNGGGLSVMPGFEGRYKVLGMTGADYWPIERKRWPRSTYWTWPYDESWRRALCYPQVPLQWVTLGMWVASPLHYPCFVDTPGELLEREAELVARLQCGAKAMGGTLLIIAPGTGRLVRKDGLETLDSMHGFVVEETPALAASH